MSSSEDKFQITKGEALTIPLTLMQSNGKPFDLTGATEIEFCIANDDGGVITINLSSGDITVVTAILGEINVVMSSVNSNLLKVEDNQTFIVRVTKSATDIRIARFNRAIEVFDSECA